MLHWEKRIRVFIHLSIPILRSRGNYFSYYSTLPNVACILYRLNFKCWFKFCQFFLLMWHPKVDPKKHCSLQKWPKNHLPTFNQIVSKSELHPPYIWMSWEFSAKYKYRLFTLACINQIHINWTKLWAFFSWKYWLMFKPSL